MKRLQKMIACLLAVVLLASPLGTVAGAAQGDAVCPRIFVHGFMAVPVLKDKNDPQSEQLFPPSGSKIAATVTAALPSLALSLLTGGIDAFGNKACDVANDLMSAAYLAEDCTVRDDSGAYFVYPEPQTIHKNSKLEFCYDWRLDPLELAAQLSAFIDYVLKCSGARQVNLTAHSFGSVVVLSYATLYGTEKIRGVCFNAAALFGETYDGELMQGKMTFQGDALVQYLYYAAGCTPYPALASAPIPLLSLLGIGNASAYVGNALLDKLRDKIFSQVMAPMFCRWLSIWSMVPDEYIDDAMAWVFDEVCAGQDTTVLRQRVEAYNTTVRCKKAETLRRLNETSNVYVLARYGYSSIPLTPSYRQLGDGNVDTKYASFGATTCLYGETLPEAYLQTADAAFISPDRTVDASTCLFPMQTWFIRDFPHAMLPESVTEFSDQLLEYPTQATVDTFAEYPRFLVFDRDGEQILPDTSNAGQLQQMLAELRRLVRYCHK